MIAIQVRRGARDVLYSHKYDNLYKEASKRLLANYEAKWGRLAIARTYCVKGHFVPYSYCQTYPFLFTKYVRATSGCVYIIYDHSLVYSNGGGVHTIDLCFFSKNKWMTLFDEMPRLFPK